MRNRSSHCLIFLKPVHNTKAVKQNDHHKIWWTNRTFDFFQQMLLNIKHILWLCCLCEAATATGTFWSRKCFSFLHLLPSPTLSDTKSFDTVTFSGCLYPTDYLQPTDWDFQWYLTTLRLHFVCGVADCDKPPPYFFLWNWPDFTQWRRWQRWPLRFAHRPLWPPWLSWPPCSCPCLRVWMDTFQLDWAPSLEITAGFIPHPNKALC